MYALNRVLPWRVPKFIALAICIALVPSLASSNTTSAHAAQTANQAIERVVTQALSAKDTVFIVHGNVGESSTTVAIPTAGDIQVAQSTAEQELNSLYVPGSALLASTISSVRRGLGAE